MTTRCARASSRRWSASCLSVSGFAPKQRRRPRCFSSSRAGTTRIDCTPHWAMSRRSTTRGRIIKMLQAVLDLSSAQPSTESGQLQTDTFRGRTTVSRWRDPAWLAWLAVPLYWVHQFEEYSLPVIGIDYSIQEMICEKIGFPPYPDCPIPLAFYPVVNIA